MSKCKNIEMKWMTMKMNNKQWQNERNIWKNK